MSIIRHPKNIVELAKQINTVIDNYWSGELPEKELIELLLYWAANEGKKLFKGNDYNPTLKQRVGQKRLEVVSRILERDHERIGE